MTSLLIAVDEIPLKCGPLEVCQREEEAVRRSEPMSGWFLLVPWP